MDQPKSKPQSPGFFIQFGTWIMLIGKKLNSWFFLEKKEFPSNESGELLRRYLANKSWFDSLSSLWLDLSFVTKVTIAAAITLLCGLIVSASTISILFTFVILATTHGLLLAHEHHRIEVAHLMIKETITLNQDLETSKKLAEKTINTLNTAITELSAQIALMEQQAAKLNTPIQVLNQHAQDLNAPVKEVQKATTALITEEQTAKAQMEQTSLQLNQLNSGIAQTTIQVKAVGQAASQFSQSVSDIQRSQKEYSSAVSQFRLFVKEHAVPEAIVSTSNDELTSIAQAGIDENDRLIARLQLSPSSFSGIKGN